MEVDEMLGLLDSNMSYEPLYKSLLDFMLDATNKTKLNDPSVTRIIHGLKPGENFWISAYVVQGCERLYELSPFPEGDNSSLRLGITTESIKRFWKDFESILIERERVLFRGRCVKELNEILFDIQEIEHVSESDDFTNDDDD